MATANTIKFGDNLDVTDEGSGVIRVDAAGGSLPDWWTVDSTPGSESVEFAGSVEIDPGRDVSALVLRGDAGQTEHIMRVYNADGDLALDVDESGTLDCLWVVVQDPPDTGGAPGSVGIRPGGITVVSDGTFIPVEVRDLSANVTMRLRQSGFGGLFEITPVDDGDAALVIVSHATPTADAIQLWDNGFNNTLFAVTASGGLKPTLPTVNPGPGILWNDGGTVKVGT